MNMTTILVFLSLTMATCQPHNEHFEYADGSGNLYTLDGHTLSYDPVEPEESSSGMYDGGDPVTVELDKDDVGKLIALFEKGIAETDQHQENRAMGTGMIFYKEEGKDMSVILKMNAEVKDEIESYLRELTSSE